MASDESDSSRLLTHAQQNYNEDDETHSEEEPMETEDEGFETAQEGVSMNTTRYAKNVQTVSTDTTSDAHNVPDDADTESVQDSPAPIDPPVKNYTWKYAMGASIVSIVLAFGIGVMTNAAAYVNKEKRVTDWELQVTAGILHGLSLLGAAAGGRAADKIGRLRTISLTGIFFFLGTVMMGVFTNKYLFLSGRAIIQLGVGFSPMIATLYIAELSPVISRGCLTSLPETSLNLGTLFGHVFSYATVRLRPIFGRIVTICLGIILGALLFIGIHIMPESPRWLIMRGLINDARCVLAKTSNSEEEVNRRLDDIMVALDIPVEPNRNVGRVNVQNSGEGVWRYLFIHPSKSVFHMLVSVLGIHVLQQACGYEFILLFNPIIFEKARITSYNEKLLLAIKLQAIKIIFSLIPTFALDRIGRRPLLLISIAGMIIPLATLGACLIKIDQGDTNPNGPMAMCVPSLSVYVAFYAIGMGSIPLIYASEIFPMKLRAQGYAFAVSMNQFTGVILAVVFTPLYEVITLGGLVFMFVGITMVGFLFVYLVLPETQGKTLEHMSESFGTLFKWSRSEAKKETEMQSNSMRRQQ